MPACAGVLGVTDWGYSQVRLIISAIWFITQISVHWLMAYKCLKQKQTTEFNADRLGIGLR